MIKAIPRVLDEVTPAETEACRLWSFVPSRDGRLWVKPISAKTINKFAGRLAACDVTLVDETVMHALIEGIDLETPDYSKHNRELHVWLDSRGWFTLAQYFDSQAVKALRRHNKTLAFCQTS